MPTGITRALKAGGGSGNIPKVILKKENYIAVGAAMRGRYNSDGKTEQKIEVRNDELSNALTTVQKDSLIIEKQY